MNQILHPVFAMVALTFAVLLRMFQVRVRAVREKRVPASYFKLLQGFDPPPDVLAPARNFSNLFEMPVLFYTAAILIWAGRLTDPHYVGLAWAYFGFRLVHSLIILTRNKLRWRILAFFLSILPLLAIWVRLFIRLA